MAAVNRSALGNSRSFVDERPADPFGRTVSGRQRYRTPMALTNGDPEDRSRSSSINPLPPVNSIRAAKSAHNNTIFSRPICMRHVTIDRSAITSARSIDTAPITDGRLGRHFPTVPTDCISLEDTSSVAVRTAPHRASRSSPAGGCATGRERGLASTLRRARALSTLVPSVPVGERTALLASESTVSAVETPSKQTAVRTASSGVRS